MFQLGKGIFVSKRIDHRGMESIQHYFKTIERGNNQALIIDLPDGVDKAEVEITVRPLLRTLRQEKPKPSRLEIIQRFKGSMSNEGYQVTKYDVYS